MKFADPRILLTPAICNEKIARSTAPPACPITERGGYTVQPVPAPLSTRLEVNNKQRAGGNNQKLRLFIRGKAISGALIIRGTSQLPNPPIIVGITKKKIIIKACAVIITLYTWSSPKVLPAEPSSRRMIDLKAVPMKADQIPKIKYKVPISLWLVEYIHRTINILFKNMFIELRQMQRFTISYLTGKRCDNCAILLQIGRLWTIASRAILNSFRMVLVFFAFLFSSLSLSTTRADGHLYLFRLLTLSNSVDSYSIAFITLIFIVAGCVSIWAFYYMDLEQYFRRFIILLIGFISRMIMLIFFSNLYMTLIGWDGLGITSFLLVVYYKNRKSLGSGMITAITNRIGDCLLLCSLGFLLINSSLILLSLLLVLRMTKSAQFPFSTWLPSAIAAPTPVSALVHSSTLVTAGVYVLIRFCNSDMRILIFIGTFTMFIAGVRACAERDLKKVVALSTLSQLGIIILSIGSIEKSFCFFHLMSHAYFKALLFLCIGTHIHALYGSQDFRRFNKLRPTLYVSVFTSVSNLSLMGFVFTTGFYRKDLLLEASYMCVSTSWVVLLFLLGIGLTSCYSVKIVIWSITINAFTRTASNNLGGYSWIIKIPLSTLGGYSLFFGTNAWAFCGLLSVIINVCDKILPRCLIAFGFLLGYGVSSFCHPQFRSIFTLAPFSQGFAAMPVMAGDRQYIIDKGWVAAGSISLSSFANSIITIYNPAMTLGLCVLIIFVLYDKSVKVFINVIKHLWEGIIDQ